MAESISRRDEFLAQGKFLELAKGIKEAVQIPLIAVGKILTLSQAEKSLIDWSNRIAQNLSAPKISAALQIIKTLNEGL